MDEQIRHDKRFYSNSISIDVTNTDFKFKFNYKNRNDTEPLCEVIITPEQAKLTMLMLEKAINGFETKTRRIDVNVNQVTKTEGNPQGGDV